MVQEPAAVVGRRLRGLEGGLATALSGFEEDTAGGVQRARLCLERRGIERLSFQLPDVRAVYFTPVSYTHLTLPTKRIV